MIEDAAGAGIAWEEILIVLEGEKESRKQGSFRNVLRRREFWEEKTQVCRRWRSNSAVVLAPHPRP